MDINYESILPDIEQLIDQKNEGALINILVDLHPADIEEILNRLKKEERRYLFNLLPTELASEVLSELDTPVVTQLLKNLSEEKISSFVDQMESDDAADILAELPEEKVRKVLDGVPEEVSQEVKELLVYQEDTAGGIMAAEFVALPENATVNETIEKIREMRDEFDDLYNIWVIDENERPIGIVSLTDLVLAKGYTTLREIMDVDVRPVDVNSDQEEVANLFKKYDLVSAPVVDENMRLVGRITVDDIVDVLEEEGSEDLAYVAGAPDEEVQEDSAFILSRARIPWLLVSFLGEIVTALILQGFDGTIQQYVATAFFFPLIMAMGGSTGQQASVIVVRGLATGDINLSDTRLRLFKELRVSLLNSLVFSTLIFILIYVWQGLLFAVILSLSMFLVINLAAVAGALMPLVFKRLNIDPALATAPFIATANDVFGLLIYLTIMTLSLSYFG